VTDPYKPISGQGVSTLNRIGEKEFNHINVKGKYRKNTFILQGHSWKATHKI
jgi:hypothetical protein